MKLDIIIPRYKESDEICRHLLDSIEMQRGVNFDDVVVTIVQDGPENGKLMDETLKRPYKVVWLEKEHGGVSKARQYGFDHTDGDYVMFCDDDDAFINALGLHLLFSAMAEGHDAIISTFLEEVYMDGKWSVHPHKRDITFFHGKCYKRKYIKDNDIRMSDVLTIHEDAYFNNFAWRLTKDKVEIETPFYMWCSNKSSVMRSGSDKDSSFHYGYSYRELCRQRDEMIKEALRRGDEEFAGIVACKNVFDSFYHYCSDWHEHKDEEELKKTMFKVAEVYDKWRAVYNSADVEKKRDLCHHMRETAIRQYGFAVEIITLVDFVNMLNKIATSETMRKIKNIQNKEN